MRLTPLRGPAFEAFVAPARRYRALWRLLLGLLLAAAIWGAVLVGTLFLVTRRGATPGDPDFVLAFLGAFAGLSLGTLLAAWLLRRQHPLSLIGPDGPRPRAFLAGIAAVAGLSLVAALVPTPATLVPGVAPGPWLARLAPALLVLLIQTSAEEIAFRGFLMQGLAARFRPALLWLWPQALLFGALHWDPATFGPNAPLVVASATLTGLILGDVTARTGNLSAAIGLHFANNAIALLIVAPPSPLGSLSLWTLALDPAGASFALLLRADLAASLAAYLVWLACHLRR